MSDRSVSQCLEESALHEYLYTPIQSGHKYGKLLINDLKQSCFQIAFKEINV